MVILLAALVASSSLGAFYYLRYNQEAVIVGHDSAEVQSLASRYGVVQTTNLMIDFGNGTRHWFNGTRVQPGWNMYTVTLAVTNGRVNATCCAYGSHFVTGIEGVQSSTGSTKSWTIWTYNSTSSWHEADVGVDQLPASNDSVYAWSFCAYDPVTYVPLCSP